MLKNPTTDQTQRHLLFHLGLLTCCITMVTYFLAFVSPYWLESIPEYHSPFLRIGLWEICFDGYLHPSDYVSKAYFGCWYIYFPEFSAIRDWLNPPWYFAVQMLGIAAFICILLSTVVMGSQFVRVLNRDSNRWLRANTAFHLIAGLSITIQLVAVAVQSRDQRWMPRPDQNRLGYSFGLALVAVIASVFTLGFLVVRYVRPEEDQLIWSAGDSADAAPADKYQEAGGAAAGYYPPPQQQSAGAQSVHSQQQFSTAGGGGGGSRYFSGAGQDDSAV